MNPNCDNDKCISTTGEVRLLPTGGDGNLILCRACYEHEMAFSRSQMLDFDMRMELPIWDSLKFYEASQ